MGTAIAGISGDLIYLSLPPALANGNTAVTPTFGYSNSYSGGTYVDQGTLSLNGVGRDSETLWSDYVVPGGLTISGATVTMNDFERPDRRQSSACTINGNSTLTSSATTPSPAWPSITGRRRRRRRSTRASCCAVTGGHHVQRPERHRDQHPRRRFDLGSSSNDLHRRRGSRSRSASVNVAPLPAWSNVTAGMRSTARG